MYIMFPIIYILYINLINFFWENDQKDIKRQDVFCSSYAQSYGRTF